MKTNFLKSLFVFFITVCFALNFNQATAQTFSHQQNLNQFLELMSQKGFIDYADLIKPVERKHVFSLLQELNSNKNLNEVEKKELAFYIAGFKLEDSSFMPNKIVPPSFSHFFKKPFDQQHLFLYKDKDFGFLVDPLIIVNQSFINGHSLNTQATGFQFLGYAGKHIGFQFSFQDINERGHIDTIRLDNELPGIVRKQSTNPKLFNYSQMNATLSYKFNKGNIVVGQDQNIFGYGRSGNLVLSDKSPAYPFYAFNYQPTKWFKFNYMHAWLQSGVIDSAASYSTGNSVYGGLREKYIPKFYAIHSVEITAMPGLKFNVGESIVYSDQLELPYMLPVTFFKAFDNQKYNDNILTGSNGQIFLGFSSRNQIKRTHIYGQLFIDEIRIGSMFNAGTSRNQLGYQAGLSIADALIPNLTLSSEYTRINPFVYRNFIPAQNYTNSNFTLGDWMGANSDRLWLSANYRPKAQLSLTGYMMFINRGGAGTIEQQYFAVPQPKFGYDPQYKRTKLGFEANYSFWNNVGVRFAASQTLQKASTGASNTIREASLGIFWNKF
jgi:hypothetical protein